MKNLILALLLALAIFPSALFAQANTNKWTITPYQNASSHNISFAITNVAGLTVDYPVGSVYPQFTKDSVRVQFLLIYDPTTLIQGATDSIKHFWTGSFQFLSVKSLDSFYHVAMMPNN